MESSLLGTFELWRSVHAPCCIVLTGVPEDTAKYVWNPPNREDAEANITGVSNQPWSLQGL